MSTATALRAGVATDPGLQRTVNEDRVLADEGNGLFLVVDGLGGHAAGEMAADIAVRVISESLTATRQDPITAILSAITAANNRIFELSESREEWRGMACVLTVALIREDVVTVGHVGDSRLYIISDGHLRKMTPDHSPVGEMEDRGMLSEGEAMHHPRRNEVFRDVGSLPRAADDTEFIEVQQFPFPPKGGLLLCSDGLSDVLTTDEIRTILEHYDGSPTQTARELIKAANAAGGPDNISAVFVPGPEFIGALSTKALDVHSRHSVTRMRVEHTRRNAAFRNVLWLLGGICMGILIWAALERVTPKQPVPSEVVTESHAPTNIAVNASDPLDLAAAVLRASSGDTVTVPPGDFLGPIHLKDGVAVVAERPGTAVVRTGGSGSAESGTAIIASHADHVRLSGLRVAGDDAHPLRLGILVSDSSLQIEDVDVSGALETGIRIGGASRVNAIASFVHDNGGAGMVISDTAVVRLVGDTFERNGKLSAKPRAAIEVQSETKPDLLRNVIRDNALNFSGLYSDQLSHAAVESNIVDTKQRVANSAGKSHVKAER